VVNERPQEVLAALYPASMTVSSRGELFDFRGSEVCERVVLQVAPDLLHGIELRCVGREPHHVKAAMATDEGRDGAAAMDAESVPDQDDWTLQVAQEVAEEIDGPRDVDVSVCCEGEVKSHPPPPRRHCQCSDDRSLLPVTAALVQHRSLAAWRPGPPDQRRGEQTTLVQEDQMGVQPPGAFFTLFQSTLTQRWIASSSRSRARRSGFCAVQPSKCKRRQMWST